MKHQHITSGRLMALTMLALIWIIIPAKAATIELKMTDGRVIRGTLVSESPQAITISIAGIDSRFARDGIQSVKRFDSVAQEYQKQRAALEDDDLEGRYKLASWLFYEKKAYSLAEKELKALRSAFPDDPRVPLLLKVVKNKQSLKTTPISKKKPGSRPFHTPGKSVVSSPRKRTSAARTTSRLKQDLSAKLLTDEQINLLKVWEVNLANRPRIVFKPKEMKNFLEQYAGQDHVPNTRREKKQFLNQLKGYQQLRVIFDVKARDFYAKAKVVSDPEIFKAFKVIHRKYILNRCATSDCHGSPQAPGIVLFNKAAGRHPGPLVYTNFYILNQYKITRNGEVFDMIDREAPKRSLLLQFGLATGDAKVPHPSVRGMNPAFRKGTDDQLYQQIYRWISALFSPAPDYGLDYEVPRSPMTQVQIPDTLKR